MAEELSLEHFDLSTFVDYVYALKQERDALRAQLPSQGGEAIEVVGWRRLDRPYELTAYPSVCAMWHGVGYPVQAIYTHPADQVADGVVVPVQLLKIIEQSWRIPNGCPKSVSEEVGEIISNGLAELRALLAKSEGGKK